VASIRKEFTTEVPAAEVWDAIRDFGAVHTRLAPDLIADCRLDGPEARIVTFMGGMVLRETLVDLDDEARRLVYSADGGLTTHHNAVVQVFEEGEGRTRVVWIADLLPHDLAPEVSGLMDMVAGVIKLTLERT
jgi:carbon monoxide dehydrogenase subunit G